MTTSTYDKLKGLSKTKKEKENSRLSVSNNNYNNTNSTSSSSLHHHNSLNNTNSNNILLLQNNNSFINGSSGNGLGLGGGGGGSNMSNSNNNFEYEEVKITIRRNERGFGFEVMHGINIINVTPNSPADIGGIQSGDVIKKVNGTCITDKQPEEITRMISEATSFVELTLQRRLNKNKEKPQIIEQLQQQQQQPSTTTNDTDEKQIENDESVNPDLAETKDNSSIERSNSVKKHRKQNSMTDNILGQNSLLFKNSSNNSSRKAIKKTRPGSAVSTKSFHTQSLTSLTNAESVSDNEGDRQHDDETFQTYDDDITSNDKNSADINSFNEYSCLNQKPLQFNIFLNYLLSSTNESPNYLYFTLFVDEFVISNEKKDLLARWAYELYSTFLMQHAPLYIGVSNEITSKIEDYLEKYGSTGEKIEHVKQYFYDAHVESEKIVNQQLKSYREVHKIGLANLFPGNQYKPNSSEQDQINEIYQKNINDFVALNYNKIEDWNDIRTNEGAIAAQICCFMTCYKRYAINVKHTSKIDVEKIPTLLNKKIKVKKVPNTTIRGHSFIETIIPVRSTCMKCALPFWGIGNQGFMCQKSKCELKIHRICVKSGFMNDCLGTLKPSTKVDSRFDSILKKFSGSSKQSKSGKDEEQCGSSVFFTGEGLPDGNLPVPVAIKKYNQLGTAQSTAKPTAQTPQLTNNSAPFNRESSSPTQHCKSQIQTNQFPAPTMFKANLTTNSELDNISNSTDTSNKNDSSKDPTNACKRVGSFKVDVKKKSNISRSKSDPDPEEIKNILTPTNNRYDEKYSAETGSIYTQNSVDLSYQSTISSTSSTLPPNVSLSTMSSYVSASTISNNNKQNEHQRQSWYDSDVEVDDELPKCTITPELTKQERKIQEVINELIHTEQKHVRNLKIMKHHFYIPIKAELYLTEDERNLLFPNLDEILELHSILNSRLKKLRSEHPVVPLEQLVEIILEQFEGKNGEKFEIACAKFCENQSESMKLLQSKMRQVNDRFLTFLHRAEMDPICRKLHLKDFIPTEVQRLTKYSLLFRELTKNAENEEDKRRLEQCMNASSRISLYVNKAVTECENRKRVVEIQQRMNTSDFDQYSLKSPLLSGYKNLDISNKVLIYEGELELKDEWKGPKEENVKLTTLLFEDIIIFLERIKNESKTDLLMNNENSRKCYFLKPLMFLMGKKSLNFTPVIPLKYIKTLSESPTDKRSFHMAVCLENMSKSKSKESKTKSFETQTLFKLVAKSGDERNKWLHHLQALTGIKSGTNAISIDRRSTIEINTLDTTSNKINDSIASTTEAPVNMIDEENDLLNQLEQNTKELNELMSKRKVILEKFKIKSLSETTNHHHQDKESATTTIDINYTNDSNNKENPEYLLNSCLYVVNNISQTLIQDRLSTGIEHKYLTPIAFLQQTLESLRKHYELNKNTAPSLSSNKQVCEEIVQMEVEPRLPVIETNNSIITDHYATTEPLVNRRQSIISYNSSNEYSRNSMNGASELSEDETTEYPTATLETVIDSSSSNHNNNNHHESYHCVLHEDDDYDDLNNTSNSLRRVSNSSESTLTNNNNRMSTLLNSDMNTNTTNNNGNVLDENNIGLKIANINELSDGEMVNENVNEYHVVYNEDDDDDEDSGNQSSDEDDSVIYTTNKSEMMNNDDNDDNNIITRAADNSSHDETNTQQDLSLKGFKNINYHVVIDGVQDVLDDDHPNQQTPTLPAPPLSPQPQVRTTSSVLSDEDPSDTTRATRTITLPTYNSTTSDINTLLSDNSNRHNSSNNNDLSDDEVTNYFEIQNDASQV